MKEELDFKDYGGKHQESNFTKFFQSYFLPKKYGFEKRRAHIASLVVCGQLSRTDALTEMEIPLYKNETEMNNEIEYFAKKIGISMEEFHQLMNGPKGRHEDYANNAKLSKKIDIVISNVRKVLP